MVRIHNIHLSIDKRKFLRKNSTPQEILLWSRIKNSQLGVKFRRQHGIGAYVTDFYCPAKKLVVEIDGSQHYGDKSIEYDTERSNYFASLNMDVLRLVIWK
jgi:very-short-patch-repair endonuclease